MTVLESGDATLIEVVEGLLRDAGIPVVRRGKAVHELFGVGVLAGLIGGPMILQVAADREGEARALLAAMESDDDPAVGDGDEPP